MWCTPRLGPGPFQLELVSEKLIKPPAVSSARTELACLDQVNVITCTTRAWGWQGGRLDAAALEAALRATVTDLPFLAGRICKMEGGRLGSLHIEHSGAGALLTVATSEDARVAGMGPLTWPQPRITLAAPAIPFYIPPMDGRRVMAGKEPLMKVQLSQLADGDVLGITLSHLVCDGVRWPLLAAHLAARYRERVGGPPADPAHLLRPVDRCLMSSGAMAAQLGCEGGEWREHRLEVRPSLGGYWRLAKLLVADGLQPMQLLVLHIPAQQVAQLKQMAAEGNPVPAVTTGDAVQAACALLLHAALGRPLLPVRPHSMAALVQQATPPAYFGNAAYMLKVRLPPGSQQPGEGEHAAALRQLAGAIRQATAAFRSSPDAALRELKESEALVAAPAHHALSFLASTRLPFLTCATNYVPQQQDIDLGLGAATYQLGMTMPRARDMAVIRPACAPLSPGLFAQLCLAPRDAERLRRLPLLAQLLPQASFVGGGSA